MESSRTGSRLLQEAIEEQELTYAELGEMADVSASQISRYIRGERDIASDSFFRLCAALGIEATVSPQTTVANQNTKKVGSAEAARLWEHFADLNSQEYELAIRLLAGKTADASAEEIGMSKRQARLVSRLIVQRWIEVRR